MPFFFFFSCSFAFGAPFVGFLVEKALKEKVYQERTWEVLLHYKDNLWTGKRSLVDDPKFFLSEKGKTDPAAELEATIRGFFAESGYPNQNDHPYCKFPARRQFLTERLGIDSAKFPQVECREFEKTKEEIDPKSVTLVFPFLYISRPVSMFGHTLLRINNRYNDPLLGHAVTFNAIMPEDANVLIFSVRGLFGGERGLYSIKKYYQTIFEYTNIDKRDIWEYDLNLTEAETWTLFLHLWELVDVYSDYYFLDENCSYNLLFLLEAARPNLRLTESILWEAPSDTVKRVIDAGLTERTVYRPSHLKILEAIAKTLPDSFIGTAKYVGEGYLPIKTITEGDYPERVKAGMLDLAIEVLRYESIAKGAENEEDVAIYRKKTIDFLTARSKYKIKTDYPAEKPKNPSVGHDITRVSGGAVFSDGDFFAEAGFRLGFHSLDDSDDGYIKNSDTSVADINLRYNTDTGDIKVNKSTLVSIASYAPISRLFTPVSWKAGIGGESKYFKDGEKFVPSANIGLGGTFIFFDSVYTWLTADLDASFSDGYSSFIGVGLGGSAGVSYTYEYGKVLGEGYYRNYVLSRFESEAAVSAKYIFPVSRNNAVVAGYKRLHSHGIYKTDISLLWRFYF